MGRDLNWDLSISPRPHRLYEPRKFPVIDKGISPGMHVKLYGVSSELGKFSGHHSIRTMTIK
jgi:hypothetical protein